jgi:hypothetical protein
MHVLEHAHELVHNSSFFIGSRWIPLLHNQWGLVSAYRSRMGYLGMSPAGLTVGVIGIVDSSASATFIAWSSASTLAALGACTFAPASAAGEAFPAAAPAAVAPASATGEALGWVLVLAPSASAGQRALGCVLVGASPAWAGAESALHGLGVGEGLV